uniref:DUF148 domain-containing protein n=1 Tax=Caenorhabditis tropicalis TaxID=1561998 RepID=A0A1I7TI87_9PELO
MWLTIIIFLVAYSNAENLNSPSSEDEALAKFSKSCILKSEYLELAGGCVAQFYADMIVDYMLEYSQKAIGLAELRNVFGFAPPGPWKPRRDGPPNETELAALSTVEEYYELIEPQYTQLSRGNRYMLEERVTKVIEFYDRKFPEVRNYYRVKFQKALGDRKVDRDTVDEMIKEYKEIGETVRKAVDELIDSSVHCQRELEKREEKSNKDIRKEPKAL